MLKTLYLAAVALTMVPTIPSIATAQSTTAAQSAANEQAIGTIHERWAGLIKAKDAAAIEQLYTKDAVLMAPGEPAVKGSVAIGVRWARQLQLEGFAFSLKPEQLVVSASGDLAHDRGTYDFAATIPQVGPIKDTGKYVLVWQKVGGEWKVIADIFNSDPAPAAN